MSILEPDARTIYLSALRPPTGYRLDRAIGTTYSLDLMTLLSVPLAFALFDRAESNDELLKDPVLLLEALRRYAGRTTVYCNAGQIAVPSGRHPLFVALEPMVVEVKAPTQGGVFHPKVWAMRFVAEGAPVVYRTLVLTRNLTPDRSWDTVLVLDGKLVDRKVAYARNHPLADFVAALPSLAIAPVPAEASASAELLQDELRRVDFEVPPPFESLNFWPIGIEGYRDSPFNGSEHRRALVMSPFIRADTLAQLGRGNDDILISRADELDAIGNDGLSPFTRIFTLAENVEHDDASAGSEADASPRASPAGLHAKLYVLDHGWNTHVVTGSANASVAAFSRNVEFCVELTGKKSKVGIDELLGDGVSGIANLLQPYTPRAQATGPSEEQRQAEQRLELLRAALIDCGLSAAISNAAMPETFDVELTVQASAPVFPPGVRATVRPVSLPRGAVRSISELITGGRLVFPSMSLVGLTAFFAVDAETSVGDEVCRVAFVLRAQLRNVPEGRENTVLRSVVGSRENLVRYLMLLLADELDASTFEGLISEHQANGAGLGGPGQSSLPVLEHLLRAYARGPEKLDAIHRLVQDLRASPEGAKLLPTGFERV